jgi:hypothetical protein
MSDLQFLGHDLIFVSTKPAAGHLSLRTASGHPRRGNGLLDEGQVRAVVGTPRIGRKQSFAAFAGWMEGYTRSSSQPRIRIYRKLGGSSRAS